MSLLPMREWANDDTIGPRKLSPWERPVPEAAELDEFHSARVPALDEEDGRGTWGLRDEPAEGSPRFSDEEEEDVEFDFDEYDEEDEEFDDDEEEDLDEVDEDYEEDDEDDDYDLYDDDYEDDEL